MLGDIVDLVLDSVRPSPLVGALLPGERERLPVTSDIASLRLRDGLSFVALRLVRLLRVPGLPQKQALYSLSLLRLYFSLRRQLLVLLSLLRHRIPPVLAAIQAAVVPAEQLHLELYRVSEQVVLVLVRVYLNLVVSARNGSSHQIFRKVRGLLPLTRLRVLAPRSHMVLLESLSTGELDLTALIVRLRLRGPLLLAEQGPRLRSLFLKIVLDRRLVRPNIQSLLGRTR